MLLRVTRRFKKKKSPKFLKSGQKNHQTKKCILIKLYLKFQNTCIKPLKKPHMYYKPYFQTTCLGDNATKWLKQKVAKNVANLSSIQRSGNVQLVRLYPHQLVGHDPAETEAGPRKGLIIIATLYLLRNCGKIGLLPDGLMHVGPTVSSIA